MLESYVEKARLVDGMEMLDLGCGWGSLSLFLAEVMSSFIQTGADWVEIPKVKDYESVE